MGAYNLLHVFIEGSSSLLYGCIVRGTNASDGLSNACWMCAENWMCKCHGSSYSLALWDFALLATHKERDRGV